MILLCGIPSEAPLAMVASELDALRAQYRIFNQRRVAECHLSWEVANGAIDGTLELGNERIRLSDIDAVYLRLMDDQLLPELEHEANGSSSRRHARAFHEALYYWSDIAPARVVNRSEPQGSNSSKPFQAQLIAGFGFSVPETLITNDPELVRAFERRHGKLVYKSISGIRSVVKLLDEDDLARLDQIRWCPVQFQAFVPGRNVRVHTIGTKVFASEVRSDVVDYRYASSLGGVTQLCAIDLPDNIADKCVTMANALGLIFAGIDLKVTPDGEMYCFEVNPCPAFSYYEVNTGQPIARALAAYLAHGTQQ